MKKQLPKRHELDAKYTWNMANLFKTEALYQEAFDLAEKDVDLFCEKFEHKLNSKETINDALLSYQDIQARLSRIGAYGSLQSSTDSISEENQMRQGKAMMRFQSISKKMAFFNNELKQINDELLLAAAELNEANKYYLKDIVEDKKIYIDPRS